MSAAISILSGRPAWQRHSRNRLTVAMLLATVFIAAFIGLVRFVTDIEPPFELEIQLLHETTPVIEDPPLAAEPEEIAQIPVLPLVRLAAPVISPEEQPSRDWYALTDAAVKATIEDYSKTYSIHPQLDRKRSEAAVKFAPSRAPIKKPIWENVEIDQLGRKILVSGNCHRVLDDPSAANNDIFRTFQQHIVYCTYQKSVPKNLPWVDEIRDRHAYLSNEPTSNRSAGPVQFAHQPAG